VTFEFGYDVARRIHRHDHGAVGADGGVRAEYRWDLCWHLQSAACVGLRAAEQSDEPVEALGLKMLHDFLGFIIVRFAAQPTVRRT
jgi:hypothetical protein